MDERGRAGTVAGDWPVGRHLTLYGRSYEVVGLVGSVRHDGPGFEPDPEIYFPLAQSPSRWTSFVVASSEDRSRLVPAIRQRVADVDRRLAVERLRTMEEVVDDSLARPRLSAEVLAGFAVFGLVLALTGVYGVVAYATAQRAREFAVRMALGAEPVTLLALVLRQATRLAGCGIACGVPLAFALSRIVGSAVGATGPAAPIVFAAVSGLLVVATLAAVCVPAWRAARADPLVAFRCE